MEYTVAIEVEERWMVDIEDLNSPDPSLCYDTVILVEADDIESAENKVKDWYDRQDSDAITHYITIIKTLPKIY